VLDEILEGVGHCPTPVGGRGRRVPRGVKRKMSSYPIKMSSYPLKMSSYPLRPRAPQPITRIDFTTAVRIEK
jgi:hypothetical protein